MDDLSRNRRYVIDPAPLTGIPSWTETLNTERFHKRAPVKREPSRTPGSRAVERDTLSMIDCRMKCLKNDGGTLGIGMDPSYACTNRITSGISAANRKRTFVREL